MKKRIASLLALALVLTLLVPALAAANEMSAQDKYDALAALNIFEGVDEEGTPALDENMTRAQAATILFRVLGLEDPEVEEATFADVPVGHWANAAVEAATRVEYEAGKTVIQGREEGGFDPRAEVTVQELAALLVRALISLGADIEIDEDADIEGTSPWARGIVAAAVDVGLIPAADSYTGPATRAALASATYEAVVAAGNQEIRLSVVSHEVVSANVVTVTFNNGVVLEHQLEEALVANEPTTVEFEYNGHNYEVDVVWEVTDLVINNAQQVGASKIDVTFNQPAEEGTEVVVKRGAVSYTTEVEWNEARTVATVTLNFIPAAAEYTVEATGVEEAVTVEMVAQAATDVTIKTNSVQISGVRALDIELVNQWNEAMTFAPADYQVSAHNLTKNMTVPANINGNKWEVNTGVAGFEDGDVINVLVVYIPNPTITDTKAVQLTAVSQEASIQLNEVQPLEDESRIWVNKTGYELPYQLIDQFSGEITLGTVTADPSANATTRTISGVTFTSSNSNIVNLQTFAVDGDGKLTFNTGSTSGTVVITAIVNRTGQFSQLSIVVNNEASVESFELQMPTLYADEDNKIAYTAHNQFSEQIATGDFGPAQQAAISFGSSNPGVIHADDDISWNGDNELVINPSNAGSGVLYVYVNAELKHQYSFSVLEAAEATKITGVKDIATLFEAHGGATAVLNKDRIVIIDQYGREFDGDVQVNVATSADNPVVTVSAANFNTAGGSVTFTATTNAGSVNYVLELNGVAGSNYTLALQTVEAADIKNYELEAPGLMFSGNFGSFDYTKTLGLTGKTGDGRVVALGDNHVTNVVSSNPGVLEVDEDINAVELTPVPDAEGTALVSVWKNATKLAEISVEVSKATPVAQSASFNDSVTTELTVTGSSDISTNLVITDQYGVNIAAAELATGFWASTDSGKVSVDQTGEITGVAAGSADIVFVTRNGQTATVTVTVN